MRFLCIIALMAPSIQAALIFTLGSRKSPALSVDGNCDQVPSYFQFSQLVANNGNVDCTIYENNDCTGRSTIVPANMEIVNIQRAESSKC
ncbi:hypothetical protein K450DRAFT_217534 [Umbelopsis ramanniana AG]|uniref:Uncharacterized protein n=1 Tax=Umbelopsis ramanniana AG TaxID=1314678 RepID=A0AAD5EJF0_UMBRA|nr:uncharacterized protein K450DRAFT_217534 [Umbelopsis ramanniana AG]KAI8584694.1 hypothetical protein K450DRAFT_217534 [Umbelopsis ramanniana AG]